MDTELYFWEKVAGIYEMLDKTKVYQQLYKLIRANITTDLDVLDVGCASGLISRAIADQAKKVYAVDYSKKMIDKAKEQNTKDNIYYSVQDSTNLEFENKAFDLVIIANVLHIVKNPEDCLREIKRVLKDNGTLIAPIYIWKNLSFKGKILGLLTKLRGIPTPMKWDSEEYINFLKQNGFSCTKHIIIEASINMCYVECKLR